MKTRIIEDPTRAELRVAWAAFRENRGIDELMAMNCDALVSFRARNHLTAEDMNAAWLKWQNEWCLANFGESWESRS